MRRTPAFLVLLTLLLVGGTTAAKEDPKRAPVVVDSDGAAPENCWLMAGGCASRSCASLTRPVVGELDVAWTMKLHKKYRGKVIETPLLWHNRVFVPVYHGDGRHSIHVRNLHDGSELIPPLVLDSDVPLKASLWNDRILFRLGAKQLAMYQVLRGKLRPVWDVETKHVIVDCMLHNNKVVVREGYKLVEYDPRRRTRSVVSPGSLSLRGGMAMRGGRTYVVHYDDVGNAYAVELGAGTSRGFFIGHHGLRKPPPSIDTRLVATATDLIVQHGLAVKGGSGPPITASGVRRDLWRRSFRDEITMPDGVQPSHEGRNLFPLLGAPAAVGTDWLGVQRSKKEGLELTMGHMEADGRIRFSSLASSRRLPAYTKRATAMSSARGVMYIGASAVRAKGSRVLWEGDHNVALPPIPAKNKLLIVTADGRLHALAPRQMKSDRGIYFGALANDRTQTSFAVEKGLVVLGSGDLYEKPYTVNCKDGVCVVQTTKRRTRKVPLSELRLLLDKDGYPLYAESLRDLPDAVGGHYYYGQADAVRKLAKDGYKAGDPELMARLIGEAEQRGVPEKQLKLLRKMHQGLVDRPRKKDQKKIAKILDKEAELEQERLRGIETALAQLLQDPRRKVQLLALREMLRVNPTSAVGSKAVVERLPKFLRPEGGRFDAGAWLDVATAIEGKPFRSVIPVGDSSLGMSPQQRELGAAMSYWRKDLLGFENDQLMIMTPLREPGPIARCLVLGDLVCDALEDVFGGVEDSAISRYPMILQLFDTRKAYQKFVKQKLGATGELITKSAGHFDPDHGVSRLFLPDGDEGWEQAMETYAHELTHHWISVRCPLFRANQNARSVDTPGAWVVEGMAELVAEFRWDLAMKTWETFNRQSASLDLVASTKSNQRIPWEQYFTLTKAQLDRLSVTKHIEVPLRWRLGYSVAVTPVTLFYGQGGAACQYLYHMGGKLREGLLRYVRDHYTGKIPRGRDAVQEYFGMSAYKLGQEIEAFARDVSEGRWRPPAKK